MDERRRGWRGRWRALRVTAGWLGIVALAALLLAGCASGHASSHPTPTVSAPTITPLPASPLTWQPVNLPNGFVADRAAMNVLVVAPSNGDIAYACFEPAGISTPTPTLTPAPQLWVTHDRAATWTQLTLPASLGSVGWCSLLVDASNAQTVIVGVSTLAPGVANRYSASFDGGSSWQTLALSPDINIVDVASYGGVTYALQSAATTTGATTSLVASADHLKTWRPIDRSLTTGPMNVTAFWVNAMTGALLAQVGVIPSTTPTPTPTAPVSQATASPSASATAPPLPTQPTLWLSANGGNTWSQTQTPVAAQVISQPPVSTKPWRLCAAATDPTGIASNGLACSDDSGKTWRTQSALSISYTCTNCTIPIGSQSTRFAPATVVALPADGAILAISPDWYGSRSEIKGYGVYRLTPGAAQWQSLGPAPQPALQSGPSGGSTVLWALPSATANVDPQGRVFMATYP